MVLAEAEPASVPAAGVGAFRAGVALLPQVARQQVVAVDHLVVGRLGVGRRGQDVARPRHLQF